MQMRFTEEQIIGFLKEAESGVPAVDLCRRHGFSEASFYLWRNKFGGMTPSAYADTLVMKAVELTPESKAECY